MNKVIVVTLVLLGVACRITSSATYLTEKSRGGYQIQLHGDLNGVPQRMFTEYIVKAVLLKDGHPLGSPFDLYRADSRDSPFRAEYPSEVWVGPNTIRFLSTTYSRFRSRERVTLTNASHTTISVVSLYFGDLLLVCNLTPDSPVSIDVPAAAWMGITGRFSDGPSFDREFWLSKLNLEKKSLLIRIARTSVEVSPDPLSQ